MPARRLRGTFVRLSAAAIALSAASPAAALSTGPCTTGANAVACTWCTGPQSCGGDQSVTVSNRRTQHPEIVPIFWQDQGAGGYEWEAWSPRQNAPTQSQIIGGILGLVNGPYYASLWQYGDHVARPRMSPIAPIFTGVPEASPLGTSTAHFHDTDLQNLVDDAIGNGLVPPPMQNDNVVYVVVLPATSPGTSTGTNTRCYHASGCHYAWGEFGGAPFSFAYVVAGRDAMTTLSRETVGAIAEFEDARVQGCSFADGSGPVDDIADLCSCATERWASGLTLQAYWSAADSACVIPETWGALRYDAAAKPGVWNETTYFPRQAYGGGRGVVFTDANDDAWFLDADTGDVAQFGAAGAEFGAGRASDGSGGAVVAGLTLDTSYGVNYYNTGSKQWYAIGAPNGPATSLTVTGRGILVATDTYGQPWYYVPADRPHARWISFGGPGDQFVAVGYDVYALNPWRDSIFVWPWQNFDASGRWTQIRVGAKYAQIVGGPDAEAWATTEPGARFFWPGGTSFGQLSDALDFAVSGLAQATFVAGGNDVEAQPHDVTASWNVVDQHPVGRLISGNQLYATGCPTTYPCVVLAN